MATTAHEPSTGVSGQDVLTFNNSNLSDADYMAVILQAMQTMKDGDFSVRLPVGWTGLAGKIADSFNDIGKANQQIASELKRVGRAVGKEGKTRERLRVERRHGAWDEMEVSVNTLIEDLLRPTTEVTRAIAAEAGPQ